jgi:hypothetical protein
MGCQLSSITTQFYDSTALLNAYAHDSVIIETMLPKRNYFIEFPRGYGLREQQGECHPYVPTDRPTILFPAAEVTNI